ncbi:arsenate reductase ArsC [uncultured Demequina sp.]|uniref:arsenate reductase ArsC n=1 Tax=uncultured Demequina sp. TaxID=693499 RepID=UPI0025F6B314|nr:arsenate reductase ArsC [uncultured Demequina sp.]
MNSPLDKVATLSIDQKYALEMAAKQLESEFVGVFGRPTIERFLATSYDEFASRATVPNYLPLLAERFARQRLHALSVVQADSHDGRPVVLFLCVKNAGKSQMALGFMKHLAGDRAIGWSGGSEPGNQLNRHAVDAMHELGIDISDEFPKPWTEETLKAADVVVTMGCGDACPVYPGKRYLDWEIEGEPGTSIENVRPVRDEIERRVAALLTELGVELVAQPRATA